MWKAAQLRLACLFAIFVSIGAPGALAGECRLATFTADVTIPIGHACMGGGIAPAKEIVDPLEARGLVLLGAEKPVVILAVDWCEIRNDAYDRWREVLAGAAGTTRERVLLTAVHQHDAPVCDLTAQKLLDEVGLKNSLCDPEFHEAAVQRTAAALRESLSSARRVTHYGTGQAEVERIASNRRVEHADGSVRFSRNSATREPAMHAAPEGTVDPALRTLSFWDGNTALAAISIYATHPMSYYGKGGVSADFVGMARRLRQKDEASVFQVYMSGCSGDITAGKFNDGSPENRPRLAERLHKAMRDAWSATRRHPLTQAQLTVTPLRLEPRDTVEALEKRLRDPAARTFHRNLAAMALSWHRRVASGQPIDLPVLDLGQAKLLLLPGESFVGYQLMAQRLRPDTFVMVAGYAECAPGYIPTEDAQREGFEDVWCWVAPSAARALTTTLSESLNTSVPSSRPE